MEVLTEISRKAEPARNPPRLAFGEVTVDVESRRVRAPTGASSLEPRVFDLLLTLVERPGLTASRDHLIEKVWGEVDGSDEALSQAVAKLRRALGDDARAPRFIETVPKLGYRWIFEEPLRAPARRWSLGPAWVAGGAVLALAVGGLGGVGAYAWVKQSEERPFAVRKVRIIADGRCMKQIRIIPDHGGLAAIDRAPPPSLPPGCEPPPIPRELLKR